MSETQSARPTALLLLLAAAIVAIGFVIAGMMRRSPDDTVRRWADDARRRLTPPGAAVSEVEPIERAPGSATTSWQVETRQTWTEFAEWARGQLSWDYKLIAPTEAPSISARRTLNGDVNDIRMDRIADGPPLRVRVSFRAVVD